MRGLLEAVVAIGSGLDLESTLRRIVETADADQAVAEEMRAIAERWPDAMVIDTERGGTAGLLGKCLGQVLAAIRPHGPEHVWRPTRPYVLPG